MDALNVTKIVCSSLSVIAGAFSCFYWLRSANAEVLLSDAEGTDDMTYEINGRDVAMVGTARKQSRLSAHAAVLAAIATSLQILSTGIDAWKTLG